MAQRKRNLVKKCYQVIEHDGNKLLMVNFYKRHYLTHMACQHGHKEKSMVNGECEQKYTNLNKSFPSNTYSLLKIDCLTNNILG